MKYLMEPMVIQEKGIYFAGVRVENQSQMYSFNEAHESSSKNS
jgi:hypothetical protein